MMDQVATVLTEQVVAVVVQANQEIATFITQMVLMVHIQQYQALV
jgi:hypothetical protein